MSGLNITTAQGEIIAKRGDHGRIEKMPSGQHVFWMKGSVYNGVGDLGFEISPEEVERIIREWNESPSS